MNPKNTWAWIVVAAGLLAFIWFFERHLHPPPAGPTTLLAGFKAASVTGVQIQPAGRMPIRLQLTNGTWRLVEPVLYPARAATIESLLAGLEVIAPALFISPAELKARSRPNEDYGFNPPQASLTLETAQRQYRLWIGSRTPPGDQVYAQVVGEEGIHVLDAGLLQLVPVALNDWRDPALADFSRLRFDGLMVTNAGNILELQKDPASRLWQMIAPNKIRADTLRVEEALLRLQNQRVEDFVSDDPKADLDLFGLQTPAFTLAFRQGTNTVLSFSFGASPTNHPEQVYARRSGLNSVVVIPAEAVELWRGSRDFSEFFDRHLVSFAGAPEVIEVQAQDRFILQRPAGRAWQIVRPDSSADAMPADEAVVSQVISNLAALQVLKIVRHVVPEPELATYGLASPERRYTLKTTSNGTHSVIARLDFGIKDNQVFALRAGESMVYAINPSDLGLLPWASWQMRDRRIGDFTVADAVKISIRQEGRVRELVRTGTNSWSLAPGSQGILDEIGIAQIEETVHCLGELQAVAWLDRGDQNRAAYGFKPDGWQITIELKGGRQFGVEFGAIADTGFASAQTLLGGEPWIYEFPQRTYLLARAALSVPANLP